MTNIYYQLSDGTRTLTFILLKDFPQVNKNRDTWVSALPFVQMPFLMDQVTTQTEVTIDGEIPCGTGQPYATQALAVAALDNLTPDARTTGWTLLGGDWNGAAWAYNAAYLKFSGTNKLAIKNVRYNPVAGSYLTSRVKFTVNASLGAVY